MIQIKSIFPRFSNLLVIGWISFSSISCNNIQISENDISTTIDDKSRPNFITLQIPIPPGKYDKLVWYLPTGEKVSQMTSVTTYFPEKGEYEIKLCLTKGNSSVDIKKKITIGADDPFVQSGEKLVWHDEFDGYALNNDWWSNDTEIHVNDELQKYTLGDNIDISNGTLTITSRKVGEGQKYGDYTSGRLKSEGKKEFKYGRMEVRAKLPNGRGTWPAIWMLGNDISTIDWPACGEIDIMEHVGFNSGSIHSSLHSASSWGNTINSGKTIIKDYDTDFHIYGLNWTPEKLDFYVDSPDKVFYTYNPEKKDKDTWPFDKPFFFILNLAIGGHWGGKEGVDDAIFPKEMFVDYVRVYQSGK